MGVNLRCNLAAELVAESTLAGQSGEDIIRVKRKASSHLSCKGRILVGATQSGAKGQGSKYTRPDRRRTRRTKTAKMEMTEKKREGSSSGGTGTASDRGRNPDINGAERLQTLYHLPKQ